MISDERMRELEWLFWNETDNPQTRQWRTCLTTREALLIARWDKQLAVSLKRIRRNVMQAYRKYRDEE